MSDLIVVLLFAFMAAAWMVHEAYKWGLMHGRAEALLDNKKRVFKAMRDTCEHAACTSERRSGAYELLRRVVQ